MRWYRSGTRYYVRQTEQKKKELLPPPFLRRKKRGVDMRSRDMRSKEKPSVGKMKVTSEQSNKDDAGTLVTESSTAACEEEASKETGDQRSRISAMYSPDEEQTKKGVDASYKSYKVIKKDLTGDLDSLFVPDPKKSREYAKKLLSKEAAEIRDLANDTTRVQIIKKVSVMSARELGTIMETIGAMELSAENKRLKRELNRAQGARRAAR